MSGHPVPSLSDIGSLHTRDQKVKNIMILGTTGMLGSMMARVLSDAGHKVTAISRGDGEFDARCNDSLLWLDKFSAPDIVINCAAITRLSTVNAEVIQELLNVNSVFPWSLAARAKKQGFRLIHISTDAVFRGRYEPYREDDPCDADDLYGMSKRLGEVCSEAVLSIRTSIIGPEIVPRGHLLSWFLSHHDGQMVTGHIDRIWNGVTTLQLSQFVKKLCDTSFFRQLRQQTSILHFSPNEPISKFQLLCEINKSFGRNIAVRPAASGKPIKRILASQYDFLTGERTAGKHISLALQELDSLLKTKSVN